MEVELYNYATVNYRLPTVHELMDSSVSDLAAEYNNYEIAAGVTIQLDEDAGIDTEHLTLEARLVSAEGDSAYVVARSGMEVQLPFVNGDTVTFYCSYNLFRPEEIPGPPEAIELKLMENGETLFIETLKLEAAG